MNTATTLRPISMHIHSFSLRFRLRHHPQFDVFDFIDLAAAEGFTGVNVSANGPGLRDLGGVDAAHFARVRSHLQVTGMRCELDTSDTRPEHMRTMLRIAAEVGADRLRTYTRYSGELGDLVEWTIRDLSDIADDAERLGVTVVLENHEDFQGTVVAHILDEVDHPFIRALYDYGNSQMVGEDPLDALAAMLPHVTTVHMKDHVVVDGPGGPLVQGVPMGAGRLPIIEQTRRLHAGGQRRFCFENVWAYVAPVISDPALLPATPPFARDHGATPLDGRTLPVDEAIDGEWVAFVEGWRWLRRELDAAGFVIVGE
jgi:sugar phosphate isomerase/epimerase